MRGLVRMHKEYYPRDSMCCCFVSFLSTQECCFRCPSCVLVLFFSSTPVFSLHSFPTLSVSFSLSVHLHKGSGSYVHFCLRPCVEHISMGQACNPPT